MLRLLVTARATGPMRDRVTSHAAPSARLIIVGPERVPPGPELARLSAGSRIVSPVLVHVLHPVGAWRSRKGARRGTR